MLVVVAFFCEGGRLIANTSRRRAKAAYVGAIRKIVVVPSKGNMRSRSIYMHLRS